MEPLSQAEEHRPNVLILYLIVGVVAFGEVDERAGANSKGK